MDNLYNVKFKFTNVATHKDTDNTVFNCVYSFLRININSGNTSHVTSAFWYINTHENTNIYIYIYIYSGIADVVNI